MSPRLKEFLYHDCKEPIMKKVKTLILVSVLSVFTISMAVAKSLEVSFASPTKVGSVELKAGDYRLNVDGTKAVFTDVSTLKTFKTNVKVENSDTKFNNTRVVTSTEGGSTVVKQIEIGGSKMKAVF